MIEQKLVAHWLQDCAVQRIRFRDGLVLNLEDYNELVISVPLQLTLPATEAAAVEVVRVDPNDTSLQARPLFDFSGEKCTDAVCNNDGHLHLEFSDDHQIDVSPDDRVSARELYSRHRGSAACLAHGRVRVVQQETPVNGDVG